MFKNTGSQKLTVLAFADAGHASLDAGEPVTGDAANISMKIEQDDDGTQSASNDVAPTEVEDGQYRFDLTQAETNGDKLTFYPESSTAGVQVVAMPSNVIYTRPPNFADMGIEADGHVHGDVKEVAGQTASAAAGVDFDDIAAIYSDTAVVESDTTAIHSQTTVIESDTTVLEAAVSDVESSLVIVKSDLVVVESDTTALESAVSDVESSLVIVKSDTAAIHSQTTVVESDTAVIESDTTAIHSQTTVVESDTAVIESDTTAIHSQTTVIESDAAVIESDIIAMDLLLLDTTVATVNSQTSFDLTDGSGNNNTYKGMMVEFNDVSASDEPSIRQVQTYTAANNRITLDASPDFTVVAGDRVRVFAVPEQIGKIYSDTTIIESDAAVVESDTTAIESAVSDVESSLVIVKSDLAVVESDSTVIESDTTALASAVSDVESSLVIVKSDLVEVSSDTAVIESDTTVLEAAVSDVESSLVIVKSDLVDIYSDTTAVHSQTTVVESDTAVIESQTTVIESDVALLDSAHAEPTGVPAANETPLDKLGYVFMALRNKVTITSSKKTFFDDGGSAEWEKDLSDDNTTYTETEGNAI